MLLTSKHQRINTDSEAPFGHLCQVTLSLCAMPQRGMTHTLLMSRARAHVWQGQGFGSTILLSIPPP
jgi:hypothetical protein